MDPSPPQNLVWMLKFDDTTYTPKGRNRSVYLTRRLSGKMKEIFQVGLKMGKLELSHLSFLITPKTGNIGAFSSTGPEVWTERVRETSGPGRLLRKHSMESMFLYSPGRGGARGTRIWWWRRKECKLRTGDLGAWEAVKQQPSSMFKIARWIRGLEHKRIFVPGIGVTWMIYFIKIIYWTSYCVLECTVLLYCNQNICYSDSKRLFQTFKSRNKELSHFLAL